MLRLGVRREVARRRFAQRIWMHRAGDQVFAVSLARTPALAAGGRLAAFDLAVITY